MQTQQQLNRPAYRLALAGLIGALGVLCFAPFEQYWFAPFIWLGLFVLLLRAESTSQAALTGLSFGLGFFLSGVSWVYVSLSVFGGMPWWLAGVAAFLFCTVMALFPMLAGGIFKHYQPASCWRRSVFFAALIATVDWVRSWIFTGFPWLAVGYSQAPPSPLAGFAPLLGIHGLSLIVALSGALLLRWRTGLIFLLLIMVSGWGLKQIAWTSPSGPPISVALIQGNIPQEMKFRPEAFVKTLNTYRQLIEENPAQLTLIPETAFPAFYDQLPTGYLAALKSIVKAHGGDLIFGALSGDGEKYWNSAISIGSSPQQTYSKQHLVPFGETIPPGFSWFMDIASIPMSSFTHGASKQAPLNVAGQQVAINICYEDVFGEELIGALPQAGILANLSNTAWFGRSLAQPQHLQIARMRAVETGRPMLRATNTGMTAVIEANGNIQAQLPAFTQGALNATVSPYQGMTPYAQFGNIGFLLLASLGLLVGGWPVKRLD